MDLNKYKTKLASVSPLPAEAAFLMSERSIAPDTPLSALSYPTERGNNLYFHIYNRTIAIDTAIKDIAVQGDVNSRKITMELDRFFDGVDLTSKLARIYYVNADKEYGHQDLNDITVLPEDDNKAVVSWILDDKIAVSSGEVSFVLEFYEVNSEGIIIYRWQTMPAHFNIEEAIKCLAEAPDPDYSFYVNYCEHHDLTYDTADDLVAELAVEIIDRNIVMPSVENLVVKRDTMSRGIQFTMPRYYDGADMSTKFILIQWENALKQRDCRAAINVDFDEYDITFTWPIDGNVTAGNGMVAYSIAFIGFNSLRQFYLWQTKLSYIFVEDGIEITESLPAPPPSWLESLEMQIDSVVKQSMYYVNQTIKLNGQIQEDLIAFQTEIDQLREEANELSTQLGDQITELKNTTDEAKEAIKAVDDKLSKVDVVLDAIFKNTLSNINIVMECDKGTAHEHGEIITNNVVSWTYTPAFIPTEVEINGAALNPADMSYTDMSMISDDKNYVLVVKDAIRTLTQKLQIKFMDTIRWCVYDIPDEISIHNGSFLSRMSFKLQQEVKTTFNVNCIDGTYVYFACPSSVSPGTRFYISSIEGGFSLLYHDIPFENSFGYTTNYDIYRSDNSGLGYVTVRVGNIL